MEGNDVPEELEGDDDKAALIVAGLMMKRWGEGAVRTRGCGRQH